jgi:homocysteine S-methyltransferase
MHFTCRDRNLMGIQADALGAHALDIRNILAMTGDPPRTGDYVNATAVFDVDAIGLVNIVNNLNHGLDISANPMGSQTALLLGVGANPGEARLGKALLGGHVVQVAHFFEATYPKPRIDIER